MKERKFKKGDRVVASGNYDGKNINGLTGRILSSEMNSLNNYPVEFDKVINGHNCNHMGKDGHCWWVKADQLRPVNETIVIYQKDNEVIALNKKTGKKGIAKCGPSDTFDFATGAKLAFERLMGITEEVIEVKRHAKVGEYIKVIKEPSCEYDEYKVGDILKVVEAPLKIGGLCDTFHRAYYKTGLSKYVADSEYVVLENYKPEEKPQLYNGKVICVDNNGNSEFTTGKIYQIVDGIITTDDGDEFPKSKPISDFKDLQLYFGSSKTTKRPTIFCSAMPMKFIEVVE